MPDTPSNAYSTGGGGVSLEHQYAAILLARLLTGTPATELGDRVQLTKVRLQASDVSPVDDIVLEGSAPDGAIRASIGVRRDPKLNSSDNVSVPLIRSYLRVVTQHWSEVSAGRWMLTLAVGVQRRAVQQVDTLAVFARANPDAASFLEAVGRAGATNQATRDRLRHLRALVKDACRGDADLSGLDTDELVWRWLSVLQVLVIRLEGADTSDRTHAVTSLQSVVADRTAATADSVFARLAEISRKYASAAGQVTRGMLRRELSTFSIERYGPHHAAWQVFDTLGQLLREQTGSSIAAGSESIRLDRTDEAAALRGEVVAVAGTGVGLVVTGEPDVGKSALALRVSDDLKAEDASVVELSLRDARGTVIDFQAALGGVTIDDLFASARTGRRRLLLVDGCEAVMEGLEPIFLSLVAAAAREGFGVVCVTRADGAEYVRGALARAYATVEAIPPVRTHVVRELLADERTELARSVPALARVMADSRSAWLIGRPGLVDAILRAEVLLDPGELLCEADVFAAVWNGLILRGGSQPASAAAPEDRESAAVAIALRRLGTPGQRPDGQSLRELRSDGVLRAEINPAFSQGPDFSTDLYRDFALCKLFLFDGWEPLLAAGAPRWTVRAVRLACQSRMTHRNSVARRAVWDELVSELDMLAASDGVRWSELPYEALLTSGDAREAISELWDSLTEGEGLRTLLRLAGARYVEVGFGDQYALAPIIEVAFCEGRDLGTRWPGAQESPREVVEGLVLAWLRGMGRAGEGPDPLRQRVRDVILAEDHPLYADFAVEALAALGGDLDERAEAWLRRVADKRPSSLHPVAESVGVVVSLSNTRPDLLLDLSEAYYIEKPDPEARRFGLGYSGIRDDGIRDSRHGAVGFGGPQAAWYYGPFYRLLCVSPGKAVAFINRMLNQASQYQVTEAEKRHPGKAIAWADLTGVTLNLTERTGSRHYVGDSATWSWYRGTSVGPYACMSALLALEKYVDALHEEMGIPLATVVDLVLADCNNLAVPGLVEGFLSRHLDDAGELLDPFLANVAVWHLETARVTVEGSFRARDSDADSRTGQDKRRYSPHDTVAWMVVNARVRGDSARLETLEAVGQELLASARRAVRQRTTDDSSSRDYSEHGEAEPGDADDYLTLVESWAAEFTLANYGASTVDDQVVIQFQRPENIEQVLAPRNEEMATVHELYRLQAAYALKNETPDDWPVDPLAADIASARQMIDDRSPAAFAWPENPLVAVAAAAIRAHFFSHAVIEPEDLAWAAELVLETAENPHVDSFSTSTSLFSMGADRAAAIAVPLLLLDKFDDLDLAQARLSAALDALALSLYDEVRTAFGAGLEPVWKSPCDLDSGGVCRRHTPAWQAVVSSLSAARLGPWEYETQRRSPLLLEAPYPETLPTVPTDELLLNRLRMPIIGTAAAQSVPCVADDAEALAGPLWDAHRRAIDHWWREGYDHLSERHQAPVTKLFIDLAAEGNRDVLDSHLATVASNAQALHMFLHSFATVFSYDAKRRPNLTDFWIPTLSTALDAIGDGAALFEGPGSWADYAVAALLPTPQVDSGDLDPDATLAACRELWADPQAFEAVIDRWLTLASGEPKAADAVARFAKTASLEWQSSTGLDWLEAIMNADFRSFSGRCWFVTDWLGELRTSGALNGTGGARYRRIIDGLAAGGDRTAVGLQQFEE